MTCPTCATHLAEIQRLDGELAKARADAAQSAAIISDVNAALNRAGIFCAITFAEAIDQIAKERDKARSRGIPGLAQAIADGAQAEIDHLATERDTARAEVSRLKAGLREMREWCTEHIEHDVADYASVCNVVRDIDALIGKEPAILNHDAEQAETGGAG